MRKHPEVVGNNKKEDRGGHYPDINNENINLHKHVQFSHNPAEDIESEIDIDIEDSRISSNSLVKELIRRLSINEVPEDEEKVSPDLSFIAERYKLMNISKEQFVIGRKSSFDGRLTEFKPQSIYKRRTKVENFQYTDITSEEKPPILRKNDETSIHFRTDLAHDMYTPFHRLTTYQQTDQTGSDIKPADVEKFIDTVHFDKETETDLYEEDQHNIFDSFKNIPPQSYSQRNSYLPSTSTGQGVSISQNGDRKLTVATTDDKEKYRSFQLRSSLREENKRKNSDNKYFK